MRAEPSPEPRLEHVYVRRSGSGVGGQQPNSPVYAQIAKKRNSNSNSVAERIAQFEYQSKEIVRDSSPSVDQVRIRWGLIMKLRNLPTYCTLFSIIRWGSLRK